MGLHSVPCGTDVGWNGHDASSFWARKPPSGFGYGFATAVSVRRPLSRLKGWRSDGFT